MGTVLAAPRLRARRWLLRGAGVALALGLAALAALIVTWGLRGGWSAAPAAVARMLWYGETTVWDFRRGPTRVLEPGLPRRWHESGRTPDAATIELLKATGTLAFLVVRGRTVEVEYYAEGHGPAAASQYWSVTKSIVATLVGMAIDDGLLRSLDQRLVELVPELAGRGLDRTTLRHLIDMTSALDYVENDRPFGRHAQLTFTPATDRLLLQGFVGEGPDGVAFRYRSGETALLALALRRVLGGRTLSDYAQRRLWGPLGMEHPGIWSLDDEGGHEKAWCCIAGTARDLAKLGRLYLDRGQVGSTQVLSPRWIEDSAPRRAADGRLAYTQGWWPGAAGEGDFTAIGKDGQYLYVSPRNDTIVVRLGDRLGRSMTIEAWNTRLGAWAAAPPVAP